MFNVTPTAVARLIHLLADCTCDFAIRIVEKDGRLQLKRDQRRTDDTTFADGSRVVLLVAPQVARRLSMRTLDVRQTKRGIRLSLTRG
ncbi:MAG: hypothetical protein IT428_30215 [Planctomycetaceae bacterium]|nr:hypothetical protein [Planctomycetaceae bacterium]